MMRRRHLLLDMRRHAMVFMLCCAVLCCCGATGGMSECSDAQLFRAEQRSTEQGREERMEGGRSVMDRKGEAGQDRAV